MHRCPFQMRTLFAKFDEHRELWAGAVRCLAHLDAVLSLAEVSAQPGFSRPQFYEGASTPSFIRLKNARHPCLAQTYQGGEYIPNDAALGNAPAAIANDAPSAPNMLLLTGPNMGGKSTLLRQTCLVAILAQVINDSMKTPQNARVVLFSRRMKASQETGLEGWSIGRDEQPTPKTSNELTRRDTRRWAASYRQTRRTSRRSTGFSRGLGHQTVSWLDNRRSSWSSARPRTFSTTPPAEAWSFSTNWVSAGRQALCPPRRYLNCHNSGRGTTSIMWSSWTE